MKYDVKVFEEKYHVITEAGNKNSFTWVNDINDKTFK